MYRQQQQQRPAGDGHMGVDEGGCGAQGARGIVATGGLNEPSPSSPPQGCEE